MSAPARYRTELCFWCGDRSTTEMLLEPEVRSRRGEMRKAARYVGVCEQHKPVLERARRMEELREEIKSRRRRGLDVLEHERTLDRLAHG
jgi:hypothetical protein